MREEGLGPGELRDLYARFAPVVHRRALAMLGRDADAWDAVQEVFERMLTAREAFRREARPMTYVYRVTTNVCLNVLRARRTREGRGEAPTEEPAVDHGGTEAAQFLSALAGHLSERELEIVVLSFIDELTQDEIADVLGLSRKTIGRELSSVRSRASELARPPREGVSHG